jgi:hypothetical protein
MRSSIRLIGSAVAVICVLLALTGAAQAGLKATAVVYAWDEVANRFQNSNVIINFDGSWVSFLHELNFDNDVYPTEYPEAQLPEACPGGGATQWAGEMEYGLYHTDDAPLGAPGFQESRNWQLVSCDRDGDGDFDNADLSLYPPTSVTPYLGGDFQVLSQDVVVPCTTGNCFDEIVTTMFVNLDVDCDGVINDDIPPGGICFYAEARTPLTGTPFWGGPLQARISAGGGDKTVNFAPQEVPTAITLASFTATSLGDEVLLAWETTMEIDNVGFNLYRSESIYGPRTRINDTLIPSQASGLSGATYTFVDDDVVIGRRYFYWLEDIGIDRATMNGPAVIDVFHQVYLPMVRN